MTRTRLVGAAIVVVALALGACAEPTAPDPAERFVPRCQDCRAPRPDSARLHLAAR